MLISDLRVIGDKLQILRKRNGLTQEETAERADVSIRTYADIERGTANAHLSTLIKICDVFHITPDEILTDNQRSLAIQQEDLFERLNGLPPKERKTALQLLEIYIMSV